MNNRERSNEEKLRIVNIDREGRYKGKNFMKRIKERWVRENPVKPRTTQNTDNTKRFRKEGWERQQKVSDTCRIDMQTRNVEWNT